MEIKWNVQDKYNRGDIFFLKKNYGRRYAKKIEGHEHNGTIFLFLPPPPPQHK